MAKCVLLILIAFVLSCKGQSPRRDGNLFRGSSAKEKSTSSHLLKYETPLSRSYGVLDKAFVNMVKGPTARLPKLKYRDSTRYTKKAIVMPGLTQDSSNVLPSETSNPAANIMKDFKDTHQPPTIYIVGDSSPKKDININSIIVKNNDFIIKEINGVNEKPRLQRKHQEGERTEDMKALRMDAVNQGTSEEKNLSISEKYEVKPLLSETDKELIGGSLCTFLTLSVAAVAVYYGKILPARKKKMEYTATLNLTISKGDSTTETKISDVVDENPQILNSSELLPSTESDRRTNFPIDQ